jgi:hypothetical protein
MTGKILRLIVLCACIRAAPFEIHGQVDPAGAQVDLYFPHLADGGARSQIIP